MIDAEEVKGAGHFWSELPLVHASAPAAAAGGASGSAAGAAEAACEKVWFSPMLNRLTREEPEVTRGGLLALEMGLGKTIVSLACVLAAPQTPAATAAKAAQYSAALAAAPTAAAKKRVLIPSHATLVVCAVSLVGQWMDEAKAKLDANSTLKMHMCARALTCEFRTHTRALAQSTAEMRAPVCRYHGQQRIKSAAELASFDLIVTTYQTLGSDYAKRGGDDTFPPLGSIHWHRCAPVASASHCIARARFLTCPLLRALSQRDS
jgi:SWI/SNF-related matrix-associated actin-dependent regulator of chromatin subfamily A3